MSADGPGSGGSTGVGDPPTSETQAAAQDAADLGRSAAGEGNQPGTATDEAGSRVQQAVDAANAAAEKLAEWASLAGPLTGLRPSTSG
jgi:hypothetical protein